MSLQFPSIVRISVLIATSCLLPGLALAEEEKSSPQFCRSLEKMFRKYDWGRPACDKLPWVTWGNSEGANPLMTLTFGEAEKPKHTTLVLAGIHGDEPTSVFLALALIADLQDRPITQNGSRLVIAPLVNPDGFLKRRRVNENGVDLNRNFPTADWSSGAHKLWIQRRNRSPMHFPGEKPASEKGTLFQMDLIDDLNPDKIISIHSPLGFIDYDGPGDSKHPDGMSDNERKALQIARVLAGSTSKRVVDYPFFPGSLGNYAGNERQIPTITLELGSSNPHAAATQWRVYRDSLRNAIGFEFHRISLAKSSVEKSPANP